MAKHRVSGNQGFTIIELLIVLAIGGFILSIVFLAIPTLQRASRNDRRKQDAAAILQAISRYELNNSANFPPDSAFLTDQNVKLSIFNPTTDLQLDTTSTTPTINAASNPDQITIYQRYKCSNSGSSATNDAADYRDVVAMFAMEISGGGSNSQCYEL